MGLTPSAGPVTFSRVETLLATPLTVMGWLRTDGAAAERELLRLGDASATNYLWLGLEADGVTPSVRAFDTPTLQTLAATGVVVSSTQWWHLALTRVDTLVRLFVSSEDQTYNATLVAAGHLSVSLTSPFTRARSVLASGCGLTNVKIFDAALSGTRIRVERDRFAFGQEGN